MIDKYASLEMIPGEEHYAEYDNEFGWFAVFGTESGFCYSQHGTEEDAEKAAAEVNSLQEEEDSPKSAARIRAEEVVTHYDLFKRIADGTLDPRSQEALPVRSFL